MNSTVELALDGKLSPADVELRDRFRQDLATGRLARVEEILGSRAEPSSPDLILALIRLEVSHRRERGELPSWEQYVERFPILCQRGEPQWFTELTSLGGVAPTQGIDANGGAAEGGTKFAGRYQLIKRIAHGAFGVVWRAHDPLLNRPVALKLLRGQESITPAAIENLIREGQRVSQLDHAGIVPIYDAGFTPDGQAFLASKLMRGGTLDDRLKQGPVDLMEGIQIFLQIARGVQHAHERELVHRDIKPSNILFDDDGKARLGDFGLAASEWQQLSEKPSAAGTPGYMSPEQARGESHFCGPRSDIYSLGVLLYRLVVGRLPFVGVDWSDFREQILHKDPPTPRSLSPDIPVALENLILKCLHKSPADRPSSVAEMIETIECWLAERRRPHRWRAFLPNAMVQVGTVTGVGLFLWFVMAAGRERDATESTGTAIAAVVGSSVATTAAPVEVRPLNLRPVAWMPFSQSETYEWNAATNQFRFDAGFFSMFEAGVASGDRIELDMQVKVNPLQGKCGFFWGLTIDSEGMGRCWSLLVGRDSFGSPCELEIRLHRLRPVSDRYIVYDGEIVMARKVESSNLPQNHLVAVVSSDKVESVLLNDTSILARPVSLPTQWGEIKPEGKPVGVVGVESPITVAAFGVRAKSVEK
ncbi:MAG: serine/threonine protein kinase [Planctomycetaceae bacterium]|nr:serine/threonine protein kinase [Planctomycetaceae bacterium]